MCLKGYRMNGQSGLSLQESFINGKIGVFKMSGCNSAVECLLPKQDVVGSNPITRSTINLYVVTSFVNFSFYNHAYSLLCLLMPGIIGHWGRGENGGRDWICYFIKFFA